MDHHLKCIAPIVLVMFISSMMPKGAFAEEKVLYTAPPVAHKASNTLLQDAFINISIPEEVATNTEFNVRIKAYSVRRPYTTYHIRSLEPEKEEPGWLSTVFESEEEKEKKRKEWNDRFKENSTPSSFMGVETIEAKNIPIPNGSIDIIVLEGFKLTRKGPSNDKDGSRIYEIRSPSSPGKYEITFQFNDKNASLSRSYTLNVREMTISDHLFGNMPEDLSSTSELWYTKGMVFCGTLIFFAIFSIYLNSNKP